MREQGKNFVIGIVTLVALGGVSTLLLQFGELDSFLHPTYPVEIRLNQAGTTRVGSPVTLNGVRVGTVTSVKLVQDAENPVVTKAQIERIYYHLDDEIHLTDTLAELPQEIRRYD